MYKGKKNNVYIEFYIEKRNNLYMSLFKSQQDRSKPRVKKGMPYLILCTILRKIISTPKYSKPFKINKKSDFTLTAGNIGIANFNLEKLSKYYEGLGFKEYDKEQNDEPELMRFFKQPIESFLNNCNKRFDSKKEEKIYDFGELLDISYKFKKTINIKPKKKEKPIKNKKGQTFTTPNTSMGNSQQLEECIFFERNLENLHNLIYKNGKYKTFSKNKEYDINSSFIKLFEFKHFFIPSFKKIDFEENLKCRNYYDLSENIKKKKIMEKQYEDIIKFYQDTNYKHNDKLIKHLKLKIDVFSEIRNRKKFLTKKEQIEILNLVDIKQKKKEPKTKKENRE